jgi:prevent-host-death family protein
MGKIMSRITTVAASEAKAKFSELLDRVRKGESFCITLHGEAAANLVPAKRPSLEQIRVVIARMKAQRSILNPPGKKKLKVKDLIDEGRP